MTKSLTYTKNISFAALAIAAGVLLPQIAHIAGGKSLGNILLPMHLPVLLSGFMLKKYYGAFCGALIPAVSFLITGMPPVPRLLFMIPELFIYGFTVSLLYKRFKLNSLVCLIISMAAGRIVYFLCLTFAIDIFGFKIPGIVSPWLAVSDAVITGLPGIILQLFIIPTLLYSLKKGGFLND